MLTILTMPNFIYPPPPTFQRRELSLLYSTLSLCVYVLCESVFVFFSLPLLLELTLHLVLPYSIFSSCLFFHITPLILSSLKRSIQITRSFSSHSFLSTPTPRIVLRYPYPHRQQHPHPHPVCPYCDARTVLSILYCTYLTVVPLRILSRCLLGLSTEKFVRL